MALLDRMDAIATHAAAAAVVAGGAKFYDVAVGFPVGKGKCVRIFYGGERAAEHAPEDKTLNSLLIGQAIIVRGYWPQSETATKQQRVTEGEMGTFVKELRTRILGDSQLGGYAVDLNITPAQAEQVVVGGTKYSIVDMEIAVDWDEYAIAP